MKVAFLLYGQPRDYINGFNNISKFISSQTIEVDFFYHCWMLNKDDKYDISPWRYINESMLYLKENTLEHLKELYKPVKYEYEYQKRDFDESLYINTILYENTVNIDKCHKNITNTLSQIYSLNKVRNLFDTHIKENNIKYDFVITSRFDIIYSLELDISLLDTEKTYVSRINYPRKLFFPDYMITPPSIFLKWSNIYETLKDIATKDVVDTFKELGEILLINSEQLYLAKYILEYKNFNNIIYHPAIKSPI